MYVKYHPFGASFHFLVDGGEEGAPSPVQKLLNFSE